MQRTGQCKTCDFLTKWNEINCTYALRLDYKEGISMDKQRIDRRLLKTRESEMMVA